MDELKSWGLTVCFAALAAGIATIITPSGKLEKMFKFTVSLFFLCCLLIPLFSLNNILPKEITLTNPNTVTNDALNSAVTQQAQKISSEKIEAMVRDCCTACGVKAQSIDVKIITNKDGSMNAQNVEMVLKKQDKAKSDEVSQAIKQKLGLTVNTYYE